MSEHLNPPSNFLAGVLFNFGDGQSVDFVNHIIQCSFISKLKPVDHDFPVLEKISNLGNLI